MAQKPVLPELGKDAARQLLGETRPLDSITPLYIAI